MSDAIDKNARHHIDSLHAQTTQRNKATKRRIDALEERLAVLEAKIAEWEEVE